MIPRGDTTTANDAISRYWWSLTFVNTAKNGTLKLKELAAYFDAPLFIIREVIAMNTQTRLGSRAVTVVLVAILYAASKSLAQSLGLDLPATGFFADTFGVGNAGLLMVWAIGHCDGMDGPVVSLAKKALETGDVNLVLPWVREQDENEIRKTFDHTMSVRKLGPQARELADMHFFETLVRIHRAGEGAPFTGLKPAGRDLGPAIPAADLALENGSVDTVVKLVTDEVARGIRERFQAARSKRRFGSNDVEAGRDYVAAYVPYIHFVEHLYDIAKESAHGHHHDAEAAVAHAH